MSSGVTCGAEPTGTFNDFKLGKAVDGSKVKALVFCIKDKKEIVLEKTLGTKGGCEDANWKELQGFVGDEPRYILYDMCYSTDDGRPQAKIVFIFWSPDSAPVMKKMLYASSKAAITTAFNGIAKEYQANDQDDLCKEDVIKKCKS